MNFTRYTNLSDEEFVNALETLQMENNALTLGPETATELFERMRKWIKREDEYEALVERNEEVEEENRSLKEEITDLGMEVADLVERSAD